LLFAEYETISTSANGQEFNLISPEEIKGLKIRMLGMHQIQNASLAVSAAIGLRKKGFEVSNESIMKGLEKTLWRGRIEKLNENPLVIADAAHNEEGLNMLFETLRLFEFQKLVVVFGVMKDKEISILKKLLKEKDVSLIITKVDYHRAEEPENIREKLGFGEIEMPVSKAIEKALETAGKKDLVLITGSIYLIGEAFEFFGKSV